MRKDRSIYLYYQFVLLRVKEWPYSIWSINRPYSKFLFQPKVKVCISKLLNQMFDYQLESINQVHNWNFPLLNYQFWFWQSNTESKFFQAHHAYFTISFDHLIFIHKASSQKNVKEGPEFSNLSKFRFLLIYYWIDLFCSDYVKDLFFWRSWTEPV